MKTAHSRVSKSRREYAGLVPKFWRKKLTATQSLDCKIVHWDLITRFTSGIAEPQDLWDWLETGYTYLQIIELQQQDGTQFTPEALSAMDEQVDIYADVVSRYRITGRVAFSGPELRIARSAAGVMDSLSDIDKNGIAERAARISTAAFDRIRALGAMELQHELQQLPLRL